MAKFKRLNDQYAITLKAYEALGNDLHVGDVVSAKEDPAHVGIYVIEKLTDSDDVVTAHAAGKEVLILSQGDQITNKSMSVINDQDVDTSYKSYAVSTLIDMSAATTYDTAKLVTGYVVQDSTNIQF